MGNVLLYVNYTLVRLIFKFKGKKIMTLQKIFLRPRKVLPSMPRPLVQKRLEW